MTYKVKYVGFGRKGRPFTKSEYKKSFIMKKSGMPYSKYLKEAKERKKKKLKDLFK